MSLPLYVIAHQLRTLADQTDDNGELPADVESQLSALDLALSDKVGGIVALTREWSAQAEMYEREERHFATLKVARRKRAERLKAYAVRVLTDAGIPKVETNVGTVAVRTAGTPKVTSADDPGTWPIAWEAFTVQKTSYELDRRAILAAHKDGKELPPGVAVTRSSYLDVR